MNRYIFWIFSYLFSGCGMQKADQPSFDLSVLPTTFPAYFSINAALIFKHLNQTFRYRLVCFVAYDQEIHFIVKGALGIEIIGGVIDQKGITLLDRLNRVVHEWDYSRIKQHYNFDGNYLFIQSLLLGTVCNASKDKRKLIPDALSSSVTYIYDRLTNKIRGLQLMEKKKGNQLKFLYQHKIAEDKLYLSGIGMLFSLKYKEACYTGNIILHKFHFKQLKKLNSKLTIPRYYHHK
ncbi:DUF4292 domain-containing protein [Candidatus Cardinium sp. cBcalN2]|uniref:DUF4292 domain-containing protein n=2 Tax=unclassified Candidatus Cardinium TaxID=2641185 RepID=UPI001FB30460|nr:DUF4292 domain-containing protein [Candidatus Cardinium sp. cBcalN2]